MNSENTIMCSTCKCVKNTNEMRKDRKQCLLCRSKTSTKYYLNNKDTILKNMGKRYSDGSTAHKNNFKSIVEHKNQQCVDCKMHYPFYIMDLDHDIKTDKKFNLSRASSRSEEAIKIELLKCVVRCSNCHRAKTYLERKRIGIEKCCRTLLRRRAIQEKINQIKMEPCLDCNRSYNPWQMDFDHVNPKSKFMDIGSLLRKTLVWEIIVNEINKCELVCSNCHRQRTYDRNKNMNNNDLIALVDLDGTLADYESGMRNAMQKLQAPGETDYAFFSQKPDFIRARESLIKMQSGFWQSLTPMPLGFDVVEDLRSVGFKLHVLTKGPKTIASAWTEKFLWCQQHIPDADITITHDKSLVYGRILVDDYPPYFLKWLETRPRGLVICVANDLNRGLADKNIIIYDGTNRAQVRNAIRAAYEREPRAEW